MVSLCGGISHILTLDRNIASDFRRIWGNTLQQGVGFFISSAFFLIQFLQADEAGKSLHLQAAQWAEIYAEMVENVG